MTRRVQILWAEDEDPNFDEYREALDAFLRNRGLGYELIRAFNGDHVYRILSDRTSSDPRAFPDLLVVDIQMAAWNGIDTVEDLASKYPGLPKIIVSGRTQQPAFESVLPELVRRRTIRGYYPSKPTEAWCAAIWEALTFRDRVILHISDLHFGGSHAFQARLSLGDFMALLFSQLPSNQKPSLIIVTGDLADRGLTPQFQQALQFLNQLQVLAGIGPENVVIVPGNHDIFRPDEQPCRLDKFVTFLNQFYSTTQEGVSALRNYPMLYESASRLLQKGFGEHPEDATFAVHVFDQFRLTVVALNSVVLEDSRIDFGEIHEKQLIEMRNAIGKLSPPQSGYPRIAAFHHHLFPVASWVSDGEPERVLRRQAMVLRYLVGQKIRLVLHGHTHYAAGYKYLQYFVDGKTADAEPVCIFGTGTLGSKEHVPMQPCFFATVIRLTTDSEGRLLGECCPYRLGLNLPNWEPAPVLRFDLSATS